MMDADVIIIGTGIGGGTLGRKLAESGVRVLFLEKGPAGYRAEQTPLDPMMFEPTGRQVRGFWPAPVEAQIDGHDSTFFAPLGSGVGGSSVFYAATLERPERHDLQSTPDRPHPTEGWPVSFDTLAPHFDEAERLYRICGTPDPLSQEPQPNLIAPPDLSDADKSFMASLQSNGLHPYRAHSAITYLDGCRTCLGHKCPKPCKMDGRSAGIEPALRTGNAQLIARCDVQTIVPEQAGSYRVETLQGGAIKSFRAKRVVLAAGAFGTPRLFLRSKLPDASGLAGRNLMFHLNEMIALWPKQKVGGGASKAISLRDLYHLENQRFGTVQSMGIDIRYGEIVHFLSGMLARSRFKSLPGLGLLTRAAAGIASKLFGQAHVFVGLLEDLPYPENRVLPKDGDTLAFQYTLHPELRSRRKAFRRHLRRAFKGHRKWFLTLQPELNFGHPCGTMRMGDDPTSSVVGPTGQCHGMPGLWVADASVFPTSMGVNPSLTIAALALHVAEDILADLKAQER